MNIVDARGLHPPEPFERVVDALSELALGDPLKLVGVRRDTVQFLARQFLEQRHVGEERLHLDRDLKQDSILQDDVAVAISASRPILPLFLARDNVALVNRGCP